MAKKKPSIRKISPQEFLGSFVDSNDKNLIERLSKEIVYHLYNQSLKVPTKLRKNSNQTGFCLGLVAVIGDTDYEDILNYLNIQTALLDILRQYGIIKEYKLRQDYVKPQDQDSPSENMVFADIEFYPLNIISYYEEYRKTRESIDYRVASEEPIFDGVNGVIRFGNKIYSFQKGGKNQQRLILFKELWDGRKILKNGKVKRGGEPFPAETVAVRMRLIDSAQTFFRENNKEIKKNFFSLIKNVNTNLKRKNYPIKITKKGGIQIVIKV